MWFLADCSLAVVFVIAALQVDGRFPHWVDEYQGKRYSLIWFRTHGVPTPRTTAVFDKEDLPPSRVGL